MLTVQLDEQKSVALELGTLLMEKIALEHRVATLASALEALTESGRTQVGGLPDPTAPLAPDSTPAGTLS